MTGLRITGAALVILGGVVGGASAQDMGSVVQARHNHFKEIGAAQKGISDQLKSDHPSLSQVQMYAKRLDDLAPQIPSWFPKGSGPDSGAKTHAKAEVWQKPDEFKADAAALAIQAHKLNLAAAGGDLAAIGAQFKVVGQACGACHKVFREKED